MEQCASCGKWGKKPLNRRHSYCLAKPEITLPGGGKPIKVNVPLTMDSQGKLVFICLCGSEERGSCNVTHTRKDAIAKHLGNQRRKGVYWLGIKCYQVCTFLK